MIELLTWATPNGSRPSIMLEEIGLLYTVRLIDLTAGAQFDPEFLKLSPNNKVPALIDSDENGGRRVLFESGAILLYLAEKSGMLLAKDGKDRDDALSWLFWSTTGLGPTLGRFLSQHSDHGSPSADSPLSREIIRLMLVLEKRLNEAAFLATEYSIADIATFTWLKMAFPTIKAQLGAELEDTSATERWLDTVSVRPAVQRGLRAPKIVLHRGAPAQAG